MKQRTFVLFQLLPAFLLLACSSQFLKYDKTEKLKKIEEFESKVKIVIPEEAPVESEVATATTAVARQEVPLPPQPPAKKMKEKKPTKKELAKLQAKEAAETVISAVHRPELEDAEAFVGRRPLVDPFAVGEKMVLAVKFKGFNVGNLTLEIKPFATVNDRKSYQMNLSAKTSEWYSSMYRVEDQVKVLMDYDTLVPTVYSMQVRESKQLREARMLFEKNKATFWERKVTDSGGEEEKRLNWDILEYSQNMFSSLYYLRLFPWKDGKSYAFRVADDNENMIFRGRVLRRETLETEVGTFKTIVIKPEVELKGQFKPIGDILIWISDDERKFILKIDAEVKMGTFHGRIIELKTGTPAQ